MKLLIFSDLHLHLFGAFALNKNSVENSRYTAIVSVLKQIFDYAVKFKVDIIIINGDLFETKNVVDCVVNNTLWDWCKSCSDNNIQVIMNVGNHDIASIGDETMTLLHPYKSIKGVRVIDKPTIIPHTQLDGMCNLTIIPFRRKVDKARAAIMDCVTQIKTNPEVFKGNNDPMNLMFYHGALNGAKLKGCEFNSEKDALGISDLFYAFFDYVFLGHFHLRQKMADNILYTGNPLHQDAGDTGDQKGFFIMDCRSAKLTFVPTSYPEFREIILYTKADLIKCDALDDYNYYTIKVRTADIKESELRYTQHNIRVKFEVEAIEDTRIENVNVDTDRNVIVDKFIDHKKPEGFDLAHLKDMGKKYIRLATGGSKND